ncbi:energy transducer TonB [Longimicrobium sp.]|uniref:energy transducer TonB n=1 Tax=Longimicrobium sp. TaxID=2029185 RepID=UPI003B3A7021
MRHLAFLLALAAAPAAAQQTPPDSSRVYELSEVEVLPRPQNASELITALNQGYPQHLREAGVGGMVQVAFVVRPDGQPVDVRVLSTPDSSFNTPTVQAVSLLRFTPAQVQGRPVAVRVEQPITWRVVAATAPVVLEGDTTVYEITAVGEAPRLLNARQFGDVLAREYPLTSYDASMQAEVRVRFRVEADGTTNTPSVTRSTDPRFDEATLRAVQVLRFSPARLNGQPVRVWVEQPVHWTAPPPSMRPRNRP